MSQAQVVIDSCYYGCITEVATMMQAFVHPSKVTKLKLRIISSTLEIM